MSEIDPVILELRADLGRYRAELKSTTSLVEVQLGRQEKSAQKLEAQMRRSSGAISGSLKGIAASLGTAFGAREIVGLIDNFTRLQNSLRVSGLEGAKLASVQSSLLALSSKYGVSVNDLAGLYGKSALSAKELGASSAQLLQITEASAQALKITGTSAVQAQGALLGLTQALGGSKVQAQEYNQIIEGGLQPLLQVVANTEKYGGSLGKFRAAVVDGKVSSQEFYQAILTGSAQLDAQASKATLTLAGAFTALGSNLVVLTGQYAESSGVTTAFANSIEYLSNNLDSIIPALAVIATFMGTRYVAGAVAATISSGALTAAFASMGIGASAAVGPIAALSAVLRANPIGIVVTAVAALAAGLTYLAFESAKTSKAAQDVNNSIAEQDAKFADLKQKISGAAGESNKLTNEQRTLITATAGLTNQVDALGTAWGKVAASAKAAELAQARATLSQANSNFISKDAEFRSSKTQLNARTAGVPQSARSRIPGIKRTVDQAQLSFDQRRNAAQNAVIARDELRRIENRKLETFRPVTVASAPKPGKAPKAAKTPKGREKSGPSQSELDARADAQERALNQEVLRAKASLATNIEARAEYEIEALANEREQRNVDLAANKDLTKSQRAAQQAIIDELFGSASKFDPKTGIETQGKTSLIQQQIVRDKQAQLAEELAQLSEIENQGKVADLDNQLSLATSNKERRRIALEIVAIEGASKIAGLEAQLALQGISDEKKKELAASIANAKAEQSRAKANAKIGTSGALEQYRRQIDSVNFSDSAEQFGVDAIKDLNKGLAEAIVNGGSLGDVLENTGKRFLAQLLEIAIQLLIIKPLLAALGVDSGSSEQRKDEGSGGSSAGDIGKAIGGVIGAIFGRASGGPVRAGQTYRVNESQQEFFKPTVNGNIIPLSQMNAVASSQSSGNQTVTLMVQLSGDLDARIQSQSANIAVQVVRQAAPSIREAAVNETLRRGQRSRIGG